MSLSVVQLQRIAEYQQALHENDAEKIEDAERYLLALNINLEMAKLVGFDKDDLKKLRGDR